MTFDGTNVDPDELPKFSTGARERADSATTAADAVAGVRMGRGMLGLLCQVFMDDVTGSQQQIVSNVRVMGTNLLADSAIATANATELADTEAAHVSQFKELS